MPKKKIKAKKLTETQRCTHNLNETDWQFLDDKIKIYSKCKECGCTMVEVYQFMEGYEMDKDGNIISTFY